MADNQLQQRRKLYFELSSQIAQIDNARLLSLFDNSEPHGSWGKNQIIDLGRSKVFVKRVPITDLEYGAMFSTRNLYDLPPWYNYGYGSVGLGVFREFVTHIKTTNWVLSGEIATFPLMYHYRIVPFDGVHAEVDMERHARYVAYWGGNANIGRYVLDRANANYEMVLFLEYIPHMAAKWLLDNPAEISLVLDDMQATITFLRKNGILHLDSHFSNILTDGKRAYLTDFGLVLDRHFELTPAEKQFYRQNSYYDYGLLLWSLGFHLPWMYHKLTETDKNRIAGKLGIQADLAANELMYVLLNNFDEVVSSGLMKLDKNYISRFAKYKSVIRFIHDFYSSMRKNDAKDTRFDHPTLLRLLRETGFVPSSMR